MSTKFKKATTDDIFQRRVRVRREQSESIDTTPSETEIDVDDSGAEEASASDDSTSGSEKNHENEDISEKPTMISFGALAKAQAALSKPEKKIRTKNGETWEDNEALERKPGWKDRRDFNRSSKHAPIEISSKKAVSRKREVIPVAKRQFRDPRFDPLNGTIDESKVKAAYAFLDDYREDEMKELKAAIRTASNEDMKEKLKRALLAMESRKKAQLRKFKEQEILDRYRKEEKELVKQGKKPFYLKKSEQKKRMLLDQFQELKGKHLDHVLQRRRKKMDAKEKKRMPFARRVFD